MSSVSAALPRGISSDRSAGVRELLLDVAERMFAERGIDAVSLNQIVRAADQRNATVIQYHFGSKTALLQAIAERGMRVANERRLEIIRQALSPNRSANMRCLAEAMVLPFAEHLSTERGSYYIRFAAQLYSDPRVEFFELIKGSHDTGMRETRRVAMELLSNLPADVVKNRLAVVTTLIYSSLADREKLCSVGKYSGVARLHTAEFINDLIAMVVAALDAPYVNQR